MSYFFPQNIPSLSAPTKNLGHSITNKTFFHQKHMFRLQFI